MNPPVVGLIVPPAAGAVPEDARHLYDDTRVRFVARGLGIGGVSPAGFAPVMDRIVTQALELKAEGARAVSLMGTSISFFRGPTRTEELRTMLEQATGLPCTTMSHAVVRALKALGVRRVAVATSYIDALNDRLVEHLAHEGLQVTAIRGLGLVDVPDVVAVTPRTLQDLAQSVLEQDRSAEGIFISCGGLLTHEVIEPLEQRLGLPVTASSPSGFWDAMRVAGLDPTSTGFGRLFERAP